MGASGGSLSDGASAGSATEQHVRLRFLLDDDSVLSVGEGRGRAAPAVSDRGAVGMAESKAGAEPQEAAVGVAV